jgi:hypothetical protein
MSVQQAEGCNHREKSMTARSRTGRHTVISVPWRDRLLSALVVLLAGTWLLGTSAFGGVLEDVDCLNLYQTYGWLPNKACHEIIEMTGEAPVLVRCRPGYIPTTWGSCLPAPGGFPELGAGGGVPDPHRDRCAQCRVEAVQCTEQAQDGVERCLQWGRAYANNLCRDIRRNCNGTKIKPDLAERACLGATERLPPRERQHCYRPGTDACVEACIEGNPDGGGRALTLDGRLFRLSASVTISARDGIAKGCIALGFQANQACEQKKLACDQAAQCPNPGITPRIKFGREILKKRVLPK